MRDLHIDLLISLGRWAQEMLDPTSNKSQKGNQTSGHVPPASSRAHCSWCPEDLRPSRTEGMRGSNTVWGGKESDSTNEDKRGNIFWKQSSSVCDATAEARQHVPRECWMLQSLKFHVDSSNTSSSWFSKIQSPGKTRKHLGNPLAGGSRASISVDPWSDARNGMLLIQTRLWRLTRLGEDEGRPADRTEVEPGLGKISVIQFGGWNLGGWRGPRVHVEHVCWLDHISTSRSEWAAQLSCIGLSSPLTQQYQATFWELCQLLCP